MTQRFGSLEYQGAAIPKRIGQGNGACGLACAHPFLNGRDQFHALLLHQPFAVAEDFDVAAGHLVANRPVVGEPHADLLGYHLGFIEAGEAAHPPPPSFLPADGVLRVAILADDRVNPDCGGTPADEYSPLGLAAFLRFHRRSLR